MRRTKKSEGCIVDGQNGTWSSVTPRIGRDISIVHRLSLDYLRHLSTVLCLESATSIHPFQLNTTQGAGSVSLSGKKTSTIVIGMTMVVSGMSKAKMSTTSMEAEAQYVKSEDRCDC